MYVSNLKAEPNAGGGRIDLSWTNPSSDDFPNFVGVKIVRRERRFPSLSPPKYKNDINDFIYDGTRVYDGTDESFSDEDLKGEIVYYYTFYTCFTLDNSSNPADIRHSTNRASRITAMATSHYGLGDKLYQLLPAIYRRYDMAPENDQKEYLLRFMEIFGSQLDLIRSFVAGASQFFNLDECDGALLPLLAQWIGWSTNPSLDIDSQRNEIRYAPELYKTIGIAANLRAFVNRLTNWDCHVKEFVHNIFLSNDPEQLNIWSQRLVNGQWQDANLVSLDFAYEGAPSSFVDSDGRIWLFYHTKHRDQWDIWYKIFYQGKWSRAYQVTQGKTIDKYPAALQTDAGDIWLFWSSYDGNTWNIMAEILSVGQEGTNAPVIGEPSQLTEGMEPSAFKDDSDNIWLFWSSRRTGNWDIWYSKFDGTSLGSERQLTSGLSPDREPAGIFFDASDPNRKIWVFWSRKEREGWNIFYKTKPDTDLNDTWNPEVKLSTFMPGQERYDNREPSLTLDRQGNILVFWSSNLNGGWNIWHKTFNKVQDDWTTEAAVTSGHFTKKAPTSLKDTEGHIWLLFRSNVSISYSTEVYPSTTTFDNRYSGSTAIDVRNRERIDCYRQFQDIIHYTYDTDMENEDWYARDTIGIYLTPETEDQQLIRKNQEIVKGILNRFLPIQLRAVFIINPCVHIEFVYTEEEPIEEHFFDSTITEVYPGMSESYKDIAPFWIWIRSWSEEYQDHHSVDFSVDFPTEPIDLTYRTWHIGLEAGE